MIPNLSQTYEGKILLQIRQGDVDVLKNGLFMFKTKTIPIDDLL